MNRIALNGRFTAVPQPTGTQTAAFHLFDQIIRRNRSFELVVFADERLEGVAAWRGQPGTTLVPVPLRDRSRNYAQWWEQTILPRLCRRYGCGVAHHPITTSPLWRNGCKTVVTLHDLNFYLHPQWYARSFRLAYAFCALPGVRRADRVVTVSNYVRDQARRFLHLREDRLRMIYNGVKPLSPGRKGLGSAARYILCVGSLQPNKNLVRMIQAFVRIRDEFPGLELHVAGRPHPRLGRQDSRLPDLLVAHGVRVLGYLCEEDLASAYAGAEVYCYPSLEEGFGLPLLEAMSAGVPVLTSNISCLPEIAGPAAILVDPYSVDAIADGLRQALCLSPEQRATKKEQGQAWATRFSWQAAAAAYLELYGELV